MRSNIKDFYQTLTGLNSLDPYEADATTTKPYQVIKMGDETNFGHNRYADGILFEVHVAVDPRSGGTSQLDTYITQISDSHGSIINNGRIQRLRVVGSEFFDEKLDVLTRSVSFITFKLN